MNEQRSTKNKKNNSVVNWWKWAFLSLITLIMLSTIWLISSIQPVSIHEPNMNATEYIDQEMAFTASANREDTEHFINTFLSTTLDEEYNDFSIELQDQLNVHGYLQVFQFDVPFILSFDPYVTENGNVQLRADSVEVGSFSLPIKAAMSLLANQLDVPDFIAINSEEEMIVINLNELSEQQDIKIQMIRIDLPEDDIEMKLYFHEEMIIHNFKNKNFKLQSENK